MEIYTKHLPYKDLDKVVGNWIAGGLAIFLSLAALVLAWDAIKALSRPVEAPKTAQA